MQQDELNAIEEPRQTSKNAYDLQADKITMDYKIPKEVTQTPIDAEIIVPDIKPDIATILQSKGIVTLDKVEISSERINFQGKFTTYILYLANTPEKPVHSITLTTSFEDFITVEGISTDTYVDVSATIANLDFNVLNERKISYRAIIDIKCEGFGIIEQTIISDIENLSINHMKKSNISMNRYVDNKDDHFIIKDELIVPSGKPNIGEILESSIRVASKEVRVTDGKVAVTGELSVTTLYKGDDGGLIEFIEHEIPFNGAIEVAGAREDMFADVKLDIKEQYIQIKPDADGEERMIDIEISVGLKAKVTTKEDIEILEDAYSLNQHLSITKMPMAYQQLICRNKNQSPLKEVIQVDDNCPDMLQIFRVTGDIIFDEQSDVTILEDKVIVEGIINANILYVAVSDDAPLYSFNTVMPFRQVIETKGSDQNSIVDIESTIEHISFNLLSGKEVEARFLLCFNVVVTKENEVNVITDIDFFDMEKAEIDKMSSLTVYVVQPQDSLFKIAKKYNAELDHIIKINELDVVDRLAEGQKLLILKN